MLHAIEFDRKLGHLVPVAVGSITLAIFVNVHLGPGVEWLDVQRLITSLETRLSRQFSTLGTGSLVRRKR